jgi:hypothetical protein
MGAEGVTLFASVYLKDELRNALVSGPFASKADIPFRKPSDRVKTLLDAARSTYKTDPAAASGYLKDASRLLDYIAYHRGDIAYVEPTRPPLLIPEHVLPIPTVTVPKITETVTIDGQLNEPIWSSASRISLSHTDMGSEAQAPTQVLFAYDDANLYVGFIAQEPALDRLKETVTKRDGPAFYDDSIELFLDPWGKRHEYFQLAANLSGALFDAKVNNASVNLDWKSATVKGINSWTTEVIIPFSSLGIETPKSAEKWYANFARNRWITGKPEYFIWSVPYGSFHRPERFGTLVFE